MDGAQRKVEVRYCASSCRPQADVDAYIFHC